MNIIIEKKQTKSKLAQYLHATYFSPVPSTWLKATNNNNLVTRPELINSLIQRHLFPSTAAVKGHIRKGITDFKAQRPQ